MDKNQNTARPRDSREKRKLDYKTALESSIQSFPARLQATIGRMSVRGFARACGFSEGVLRSYLKGDTYPTLDRLEALARAGRVNEAWLATGVGPMHRGETVAESPAREYAIGNFSTTRFDSIEGGQFYAAEIFTDRSLRHLAFRHDWMQEQKLAPGRLALHTVRGDAMAPCIPAGSLLLIDRIDVRDPPSDGIYLIFTDGQMTVRRIQKNFDGSVRLLADNKAYTDQLVSREQLPELNIAGRVVWIAHPL